MCRSVSIQILGAARERHHSHHSSSSSLEPGTTEHCSSLEYFSLIWKVFSIFSTKSLSDFEQNRDFNRRPKQQNDCSCQSKLCSASIQNSNNPKTKENSWRQFGKFSFNKWQSQNVKFNNWKPIPAVETNPSISLSHKNKKYQKWFMSLWCLYWWSTREFNFQTR